MGKVTPRALQREMIKRNSKQGVIWETERRFNEYAESRVMCLQWDMYGTRTLPFIAPNRKGVLTRYDFQLDFLHPTFPHGNSYDEDWEIDGKGHKDKNDAWKDEIKNKAGIRVYHVPGELTAERYWPDLDKKITAARLEKAGTVHLSA